MEKRRKLSGKILTVLLTVMLLVTSMAAGVVWEKDRSIMWLMVIE